MTLHSRDVSRSSFRSTQGLLCLLVLFWISTAAVVHETASADRLYGSFNLSYQRTQTTNSESVIDHFGQQNLILNYEDALFTKNQIRLATNMYRREYGRADFKEFRPTYYFDLRSQGYSFNSSYSPYNQSTRDILGRSINTYYRDLRSTLSLNYDKYPTASFVYNRSKVFDRGNTQPFEALTKNYIVESGYQYKSASARVSFNSLSQDNNVSGSTNNLTRTYTTTFGFNQSFPAAGYLSSTYSFYGTDIKRQATDSQFRITSGTHSINTLFSSREFYKFSLNVSYSGRYLRTDQRGLRTDSKSEIFSAQGSYQPLGYLDVDVVKAYQINNDLGTNQIVEYWVLSSNVTRYLRQGVGTRLNVSRTIFQQSNRTVGLDGVSSRSGKYSLDTYYGSLSLAPYNYTKTLLDLSITHDNDPLTESQRYLVTRSINAQFFLSPKMEGRFTATALYQGNALKPWSSYSQNYNLGIVYYPESNINLNLTYIFTTSNTTVRNSSGSLTGYAGYSFRRAFSLYLSVNRQIQKTENLPGQPAIQEVTLKPQTVNGQVLIYLSARTTFSLGYLRNRFETPTTKTVINDSWQGVLTFQI